jgi:hypothetical protein
MLDRVERDDVKKCARILAVYRAHYRSKFGVLRMSETLELLNNETMNDDQANWIGDGHETLIAILGIAGAGAYEALNFRKATKYFSATK